MKSKRKFFVKYGDFANIYTVVWSYDDSPKEDGYERITYQEAVELCKRERYRLDYDTSVSGHATTHIFPYNDPYIGEWAEKFSRAYRDGYRVDFGNSGLKLFGYIVDYVK